MSKYKLREEKNLDQIGLNSFLKRIEDISSSTTTESSCYFSSKSTTGRYIKLIFAGTLAISSMGNIIKKDQVKFSKPECTTESLEIFNRTIENPYNSYIYELSKLTKHKGPAIKKEIIDKIIAFSSLNKNWDGYGAFPLEVKSASNAVQFIYLLNDRIIEKISDVYPTPNGTVLCVWENDANERVSLEFGNNTLAYYVKLNSQNPKFFNEIKVTAKEANIISDFIKTI